jgi:hypothetical protein
MGQFIVTVSNYQGKERIVSDFARKHSGLWDGERVVFALHDDAERFMMAVDSRGVGCSVPREENS